MGLMKKNFENFVERIDEKNLTISGEVRHEISTGEGDKKLLIEGKGETKLFHYVGEDNIIGWKITASLKPYDPSSGSKEITNAQDFGENYNGAKKSFEEDKKYYTNLE